MYYNNKCGCRQQQNLFTEQTLTTTTSNKIKNRIVSEFFDVVNKLECGIQPDLEFLLQDISKINISEDYNGVTNNIASQEERDEQLQIDVNVLKDKVTGLLEERIPNLEQRVQLLEEAKAQFEEQIRGLQEICDRLEQQGIPGIIDEETLREQIQALLDQVTGDGIKHVFVSQEEYDTLVENGELDENTLYFIVDKGNNNRWRFGQKFPIYFGTTEWNFGDPFPINF